MGGAILALAAAATALAPAEKCALTHQPPRKARYLKFCQDYNAEACCIPGHDLENQVQFENAIDGLGPGCKNPMMYPELRYFYCLGCDPKQPDYTTDWNSTDDDPEYDADNLVGEIRVCDDFVERLWNNAGFSDCGIMYPNPCPANWVDDGMDPYTCGDDLLLPTNTDSWQGITGKSTDPTGIEFLNLFPPPGLETYRFVSVSSSSGKGCWTAKAFRPNSAARLSSMSGLAIMLLGMAIPAALQRLL